MNLRTLYVRLTGRCQDCGKDARCAEHNRFGLRAHNPDMMLDDPMVNCDPCVVQYGTALGSVTHQCVTFEERLAGAIEAAGSPEALVEQALCGIKEAGK
jgi:hypothetical protein